MAWLKKKHLSSWFLTSYSLLLPGCRTNILVPLVSRRWLVIKTFIGIPYFNWRFWVQVVRTMTSCFSLMATPQLQVTPQQDQSRVWIFSKKDKKKKKMIFRYSTNQPQCSIVYVFIVYRNVDVIRKIIRKNVERNVAWFFSAISFTWKGMSIGEVLLSNWLVSYNLSKKLFLVITGAKLRLSETSISWTLFKS